MASMPEDITLKVDASDLSEIVKKIERLTRLELAFGYLLENTPCICKKHGAINVLHEPPCAVAIALNIAGGLRSWPASDK